jgi:hypothetical protein
MEVGAGYFVIPQARLSSFSNSQSLQTCQIRVHNFGCSQNIKLLVPTGRFVLLISFSWDNTDFPTQTLSIRFIKSSRLRFWITHLSSKRPFSPVHQKTARQSKTRSIISMPQSFASTRELLHCRIRLGDKTESSRLS